MPSSKKERSKKKKQAAAASPKPAASPALAAAAVRIETANAVPDLSIGLEAFLAIDLPAAKIDGTPVAGKGDAPTETGPTAAAAASAAAAAADPAPDPVRLTIRAPDTLGDGDAQRMYDLLKSNMHDMYLEAGWGWDEGEKWREMRHRHARFLVASGGAGAESDGLADEKRDGQRLAGYCHFRFAWDKDENDDGEGVGGTDDVLYVYEIQVAPWAKRRGLGRRMMQALELSANRHGMSKVMLTVFKENRQAMSFYTKKMKYGVDKDSPSNWDQPDAVYEILSKPTRQGAARAKGATQMGHAPG